MKKIVLDITDMSDSKEVYGQRPNPFIAAFIYCLVGLLMIAFLYSTVGKIDIVATSSGIIRPNDDISTVSCLIGGRITSVNYSDGQYVEAGDVLLTVNTSEAEIRLNALKKTLEDYETQLFLTEKFLDGVVDGENPFSSAAGSEEYPYFIQYRDYELSLKNTKDSFDFDVQNAKANSQEAAEQISDIENKLKGLMAYRDSVETGYDKAASYPEYEEMYRLYAASVDALALDYQTQKEKILADQTNESNAYYLDYYKGLITEYGYLVESINNEFSIFPSEYSGTCLLLWNDYCANLDEYKRAYEAAVLDYNYYLSGGTSSESMGDILAYDYAMLEGYQYYKESVQNDTDMFVAEADSAYYRSLYLKYKEKYDVLVGNAESAAGLYEQILLDPEATEESVGAALSEKLASEAAAVAFKTDTLASIDNTILQLNASISGKELELGKYSLEYNISAAKTKVESAEAVISSYKNKMLADYTQMLTDYKTKAEELKIALSTVPDTEKLLLELKKSYQNALDQKYFQTLTQIDSSIQSLQTELLSKQSSLRHYQIASNLYRNNLGEDGTPVSLSLATAEQISTLLGKEESLNGQIDDLKTQILQVEQQVAEGAVLAEKSGIISALSTFVKGDTITAGTSFARIVPVDESEYKVQLYVSSADIASVEAGDEIKYNVTALPSNQYGLLTGTVRSISKDVLSQNGEYSGYYLVEGNLENKDLTDKDGNTGSLAIGMQVEAKIVTERKTIIRYLLEKMDLF